MFSVVVVLPAPIMCPDTVHNHQQRYLMPMHTDPEINDHIRNVTGFIKKWQKKQQKV